MKKQKIIPEASCEPLAIEHLVREAFWNYYTPGCDEHYLVHKMRTTPQFLPEFSFAALEGKTLVGCILSIRSYIVSPAGDRYPVIVFGPIAVLPGKQKQGIGQKLIEHLAHTAALQNERALVIYGNPQYYCQRGFMSAKDYGISNAEGKYPFAHLVRELYPDALAGVSGRFIDDTLYECDEAAVSAYDQHFPPKEKKVLASQRFFEIAVRAFLE